MHEMSLIRDLIKEIESISKANGKSKVIGAKFKLGALSHISPDHFREHFDHASQGTIAEGAHLDVIQLTDEGDPQAQEIILESVELEE